MSQPRASQAAKTILIATIGSLGDLHPCLALGTELKHRGHKVILASTPFYKSRIEALGIEFRPLRPDWNPTNSELIRQCEDLKKGPEILFRQLVLPHLRETYNDLLAAAHGVDFMLAGELVFAAPLVAEKLPLRWASVILSPCSFFSAYDPSVLVNAPWLIHLHRAGRKPYRLALELCRKAVQHWWKPVRRLRHELGLSPNCDPMLDKFSPCLVLALFSRCFAEQQPDWPRQTRQPGFVFFDSTHPFEQPPKFDEFLASGAPPIVFTLGSTAVHNPGEFYQVSAAAAKQLGRRAILLGADPALGAANILVLPYAPYASIFPHATVIVHQGGSGTTAQVMLAGRPSLVVPYAWDQPDNAARVERLGAALVIARANYSVKNAVAALDRILSEGPFAERATNLAKCIQREDAIAEACNCVEEALGSATSDDRGFDSGLSV